MPKSLKYPNQAGIAIIVVILAVIVVLIAGVILYTQGIVKLPGKSTSSGSSTSDDVQVELKTEYENPFDKSTQYENPFSDYQNPFNELK